jgi:C4-dicarboxylate-specific signal transduction histidine kinase
MAGIPNLGQKLVAAVVMGLAISGMHYTAMRAAIFTTHGVHEAQGNPGLNQSHLAVAVAGITLIILAFASVASLFERKRAEEALRQAQTDLARVTRLTTLGELTASIAHEVNQPLAGVVANAEACLGWPDRQTPNLYEARRSVEWIIEDSNRAGEVIRRVRALATNTAAQKAPLDVNHAVNEAIALVRRELLSHQVSLRMELTSALSAVLVQLQQVIINLVINAMEAMQPVTDRPRELVIQTHQDEAHHVQVTVKDCGVGISAETADRLFKAFFTTKASGMGMGLSICRSIVAAHGGRLWAVPNLPHGATFHCTLPSHQENAP